MKPLQVRPVEPSYCPGYPRFVEVEDWESLVAASSGRLFRPSTLVFAGLLGTSLLVDARAQEAWQAVGPPLEASNEQAAAIANAALDEVKGSTFWFHNSSVKKIEVVSGNPAVTVPVIRVVFGNAYVGVFDLVRAKKAILELFDAYGVNLQSGYRFAKDGIEFEADGYDPKRCIGFEIVGSENPPRGFGNSQREVKIEPGEQLDKEETEKLKKSISAGDEAMFLTPAEAYPNMDHDQYTPLRAYLQSVLDYLEWLKQNGRL